MTERDKYITGKPPRIAPVEEFTEDVRDLLTPPPGYEPNPRSRPEMTTILLHHSELLRRYFPFMTYFLAHGTLDPRDRELAVMRMAWLNQVPFIWGEHVRYARDVGMTDEEIESVTQGSEASIWGRHDRAVLSAAEELVEDSMISDETWEILAETLSEKQLIELIACVGQYQTLGNLQNSLRIPLWDGNPGMTAR